MNMAGNKQNLVTVVVIAALFLVWELAVRYFEVKTITLPAPSVIWTEFVQDPTWYLQHAWYTLLTTLAGFALAVVFGIALAVLIVESRLLENTIYAPRRP